MSGFVADTHVVIWYVMDDPKLSKLARKAFENAANEGNQVYLPWIVFAEIVLLIKKKRFPLSLLVKLKTLVEDPDSVLQEAPVTWEVIQSLLQFPHKSIPDMPDAIIAATAVAMDLPLMTADEKIRASQVKTIW